MDDQFDPERTPQGDMDVRLDPERTSPGDVDARLHDLVVAAERALLSPEVRGDRGALERLLDERFTEIGQSGRLWTRADMIAALLSEHRKPDSLAPASTAELSEIRTTVLGPETILLTYLLHFDGRRSRRSSIWLVDSGDFDEPARLLFHQGTTTSRASGSAG